LPVAGLLREMDAVGAQWGILASGDVWRLYSASTLRGLPTSRRLTLRSSPTRRTTAPSFPRARSRATALRRRSREALASSPSDSATVCAIASTRTFVPRIVGAIAEELERTGQPPQTMQELSAVYDATLTLLYRLLFVLYAEAREYLPVGASAGYREHSLRTRIDAVIVTIDSDRDFDPRATDVWSDLQETFDAVAFGHTEWGVPPYNGGLFRNDEMTRAGRILASVRPTNAGLGEALYHWPSTRKTKNPAASTTPTSGSATSATSTRAYFSSKSTAPART